MTEHLVIDHVTKLFPSGGGVCDVSLSVEKGDMLVLLGPSGCGKTTLLRTVAGLLTPDVGRVRLDGADITRVSTHRRNMSMVFQTWALFPTMSVRDNVGFGLRMRRLPRRVRDERVRESLATVGLADYANRRPSELSGGQQQRVAVARAIATEPTMLLLDEPLSSLDHKIRVQLRSELKRLQTTLGLTGLYVTHDHTEALALGDQIAVMDTGRVVEVGEPLKVFSRPKHRYTAEFLGLANVIPAASVEPGRVRTDLGNTIELSSPPDGPITAVAVRPDDIELTSGHSDGALHGRVQAVEFQPGGALHSVLTESGHELRVITPFGAGTQAGTDVTLAPRWDTAVPLID